MIIKQSKFSPSAQPGNLFAGGTLARAIDRFHFPPDLDEKRIVLESWVEALNARRLKKETAIHGEFLQAIFCDILGYVGAAAAGDKPFTLSDEKTVGPGGTAADGAIGLFGRTYAGDRIIAPIELKGSETDLDRPMARGYTPVQQGWWYANQTPNCSWVIVSNYRETRLYSTTKTALKFERFYLQDLLDPDKFKHFYFCLCSQNLLSEAGLSALDRLLAVAGEEEKAITKKFYDRYQGFRLRLIESLILENKGTPRRILIEKAQKLLDRALFIAFCEDRELLKPQTIRRCFKSHSPGMSRWAPFRALFSALQKGSPEDEIPAYNGGLFAPDPQLDSLSIPESTADIYDSLASFDFTSELDVEILGHVFEQSITDLENIRRKQLFEGLQVREGRRKKQGIVYTPPYITHFIYERTIGRLVSEKRRELESRYKPSDKYDEKERLAAERAYWKDFGAFLEGLRILDPACGSGAFLIAAFDALSLEYQSVNKAMEELDGRPLWDNPPKSILTRNLYGVDLAPESVEITKLSLWLKTAQPGEKLTSLDSNIRCGNSLVGDRKVDPAAADWAKWFPEVMKNGGFNVVIGNPPYVRIQNFSTDYPRQVDFFKENFRSAFRNFDLSVLFVEKGLELLREDGILGYILTNKFLVSDYGQGLRGLLADERALLEVIDLDRNQVFEGVITYPALLFLKRESPAVHWSQYPEGTDIPETLRLVKAGQGPEPAMVAQDLITASPWSFRSGAEGRLLERLKAMRPTLAEVSESIFQGLVTSADPVYILEDRGPAGEGHRKLHRPESTHKGTRTKLPARDVILEEVFIKPLFKNGHVEPFFMGPASHRIVFPYDLSGEKPSLVPEERFRREAPKTWAWLQDHEGLLRIREKGKMNHDGWWAYGRTQNLGAFEGPKLVVPGFSAEQRYAYDKSDVYFTGRGDSGYGVRLRDGNEDWALFVLAVLNSRLAGFFQRSTAAAFQGGYYSSGKRFLELIPVIEPSEEDRREVSTLAVQLRDIKSKRHALLEGVRQRLKVEVLGDPYASFSRKLNDWPRLSFKALQNELYRKFKINIPFRDCPSWEKLMAETINQVQTLDRKIEEGTQDLDAGINELYGLTKEEAQLVEE